MTTDFPTWVRAEAKRQGWSQLTLAERSGLSRSGIRSVLTTGRRKPGMRFFVGIGSAFEMPVVDVIVIWEAGQRESEMNQ